MKLRLENGNFKITGTFDPAANSVANTVTIDDLPKGLSQEDFIGCVVDMGTMGLAVVTQARETEENVVDFRFAHVGLNYDPLTGKVTLAAS